jgi:hypothetical protein
MLPGLPFFEHRPLRMGYRRPIHDHQELRGSRLGAVAPLYPGAKRTVGMISCAGITKEGWIIERK